MNLFINHSIEQQNNELVVTLFIDKRFGYEEFSGEFLFKEKRRSLENEVKKYITTHLPHLKSGIVKIAFGTMILTILPLHTFAEENQPSQTDGSEYVVQIEESTSDSPTEQNEPSPDENVEIPESEIEMGQDSINIEEQNEIDTSTNSVITNTSEDNLAAEYTSYTVQAGDTLTRISKLFNITINQIKAENGLTTDVIYIGQELKIPGVNSSTEKVENETTTSYFEEGMRDPEIINLKKDLNKLGFGKISVTSYYGSFTTKKVLEFQKYYGLEETGIADAPTLDKIKEITNSPHQLNKRDAANIQLKKDLNTLGFGSISVTEFYGAYSVKKVKEFQEYHGLKVTGIADTITLNKIQELLNTPLKEGIRRPEVIDLKKDLDKVGFGGISLTDYYGGFTEKRVKEFQEHYELPITGIVDSQTRIKIDDILSSPHQVGKRDESNIELKEKLNQVGFGYIEITPYFGSYSVKKLKEFQKSYDLPVTGIGDVKTLEKLNEVVSTPLSKGMSRPDIVDLKKNLDKVGFGGISLTNYYGSFTEKRVKEFQRKYGLIVTGIADSDTLDAIEKVINGQPLIIESPILKQGVYHRDVIQLKLDLDKVGFKVSNNPTDYYGSTTTNKVMEFQQRYNLTVDGIAGKETLAKLEEVVSQTIPTPFKRVLQVGDNGEDIRLLQTYLNDAGFKVVDQPTTYYGTITESQVKLFQEQHGLTPTGVADARTLQKLVSARESVVENISSFLISGKGYGHAVGMTQWGAYGMAQEGFSYDEILKYYYTGTGIGLRDTSNQNVRVLLTENATTLTISSNQPYQVGDKEFLPNTKTTIQYQGGKYLIKNGDKTYERINSFQISSTNNGLLYFEDKQYEGTFSITTSNSKLDLVNHLNVENYLKGVVPYEIIPSWNNMDIYKVQTLAARTYVLKELQRNQNQKFDVYDTVRSQVYNGIPQDIPLYASKIYQAISDTKGEVILYNGTLIDAVYSASAGGHTVDAVDVWGKSFDYLVGKEDPYDKSSYATNWWSVTITKEELNKLYPEVGNIVHINVISTKYNRPTEIKIVGEKSTIIVSGSEFRNKVGLDKMKSNTFTIENIR